MSKELYDGLTALVQNDKPFIKREEEVKGRPVEIFSYLLNPKFFRNPYAPASVTLESRGIVFDVSDKENPIIVCRPMQKFFNWGENEEVLKINPRHLSYVMEKMDGSLISSCSFGTPGKETAECVLKSKSTFYSEHAAIATEILDQTPDLHLVVKVLSSLGYTVNFELVSPLNRHQVRYSESKLVVLNIRRNKDGIYVQPERILLPSMASILRKHWVKTIPVKEGENIELLFDTMKSDKNTEGYVCVFTDEQGREAWTKHKTDWYKALSVIGKGENVSPEHLLAICISGAVDDYLCDVTDELKRLEANVMQRVSTDYTFEVIKEIQKRKEKYDSSWTPKEIAIEMQKDNVPSPAFHAIMASVRGRSYDLSKLMKGSYGEILSKYKQAMLEETIK